jgi:hypothetical protein
MRGYASLAVASRMFLARGELGRHRRACASAGLIASWCGPAPGGMSMTYSDSPAAWLGRCSDSPRANDAHRAPLRHLRFFVRRAERFRVRWALSYLSRLSKGCSVPDRSSIPRPMQEEKASPCRSRYPGCGRRSRFFFFSRERASMIPVIRLHPSLRGRPISLDEFSPSCEPESVSAKNRLVENSTPTHRAAPYSSHG